MVATKSVNPRNDDDQKSLVVLVGVKGYTHISLPARIYHHKLSKTIQTINVKISHVHC